MREPRLLPLGEAAWTVELGDTIGAATHARVLGLAQALHAARVAGELAGVVEWVPAFRSLTVFFDPLALDADELACRLREMAGMAGTAGAEEMFGRSWRIPVCFGGEYGPDLEEVARLRGMTGEQVVARMSTIAFRVSFIGFLPGFPYLIGLPAELQLPRRETPRTRVPARSLAVAGQMCGVYPCDSPGGWHLLGRTPVPLFDAGNEAQPALLAPGDEVRWQTIDTATFAEIEARVAGGHFARESLLWRQ